LADRAPAPRRPEERRLRPDLLDLLYQNLLHVRVQELHDHRGQRDVARLAALDADAPQPPRTIEVLDTERRHGFTAHTGVAQDQPRPCRPSTPRWSRESDR